MKIKKGIFIVLLSTLSVGVYAQIDSTGRRVPSDTARSRYRAPTPGMPPPSPTYTPPLTPPNTQPKTPNNPITPTTPPSSPPPHGLTASISTRQDTLHAKKNHTQPLDSLRTRDLPRYTPRKDTIR